MLQLIKYIFFVQYYTVTEQGKTTRFYPNTVYMRCRVKGSLGLIGQEPSRNNLMWTYTFSTTTNRSCERGQ
jgi:hypothetical protein